MKNRTKNEIPTGLNTTLFTFQSAASAFSFHAGPCFSADWREMTCDVNSRTPASVSCTFYTIMAVFYNTVFLAMIIQRKMFAAHLDFNNNNQRSAMASTSHVISSQSAEKHGPAWKVPLERTVPRQSSCLVNVDDKNLDSL